MKTRMRGLLAAGVVALTAAATVGLAGVAQATDHPQTPPTTSSYVVATWAMPSWKNATTPVWPQTLVSHVVTSTGSLAQADLPDCGYLQVDVYNYTTPKDKADVDALIKGGVLKGPSNPVHEPLVSGGLGTAWTFLNKGECTTPTPTPSTTSPTPTPTETTPTPTPTTTSPTPTPTETTPTPTPTTTSPTPTPTQTTPTPTPTDPSPSDSTTPPVVVTVTPVAPGFLPPTCKYQGTITIPPVAGVQYALDGTPVSAGVKFVQPGTHTVIATALDGYVIAEGATTSWTRTFTAPSCSTSPAPTSPTPTPTTTFPETGGGDLPKTGGPSTALLGLAGGLLALGTGLLIAGRRKGSHA